jgi:hypothetical protein
MKAISELFLLGARCGAVAAATPTAGGNKAPATSREVAMEEPAQLAMEGGHGLARGSKA